MQDLPHHYSVTAQSGPEGDVSLSTEGLAPLPTAPPPEFGGPGGRWSPETLLVGAVADCFMLAFRAVARASKLSWVSLRCDVEGLLERSDGTTKFTEFKVKATLAVPRDTNEERARRLLEKAESVCLVTNSLSAATHLEAVVSIQS